MRGTICLALATAGCGDVPQRAVFQTPWEQVPASQRTVTGAFTATIDDVHPGAGWFESKAVAGRDGAWVRIHDVGAEWPVVQVLIFGLDPEKNTTLELDISYGDWVAGDIPIDGDAATGVVQLPKDDGVRYIVGGSLYLTDPGLAGEGLARGHFKSLTLSEVMP